MAPNRPSKASGAQSRGKKTSPNNSSSNTNAPVASAAPPPPAWPVVRGPAPGIELRLHTLLADQILTVPGLWTSGQCQTWVKFLQTLPLVTTPGTPKRGDAVRVNDRFQVDDAELAARLWRDTGLRDLVEAPVLDGVGDDEKELTEADRRELWGGEVLGLNSNIRVYRYSKGQFFDQHYDDSNLIQFPSATSPNRIAARTTWTLLLYLTSAATGCEGGETVFYPEAASRRAATPEPIVADLDVGMALLHRHGRECLLHEGREVTRGEKWVLRSDLCVKR